MTAGVGDIADGLDEILEKTREIASNLERAARAKENL